MQKCGAEARAQTEALRQSEERFRSAFDHAPIGMALVAPDGRWIKVNRAVCEIVGYSERELLATDFQSLTHPDDLTLDLELAREVLAGVRSHFRLEKRYLHKQGQVVTALLAVSLVRDAAGAPLHFISQLVDITELRAAEMKLQESERRLRTIADSIPAVIALYDDDDVLQFANAEYQNFALPGPGAIGKRAADILPTYFYEQSVTHRESARTGQRTSFTLQAPGKSPPAWCEVTYGPHYDASGQRRGICSVAYDVTDRVTRDNELRALTQRLETVREDERHAVANMLHEGVAQDLFAIRLLLDELKSQSCNPEIVQRACGEIQQSVDNCLLNVRQIANDLRPTALSHLRVSQALEEHARYFGRLSGLSIAVEESPGFPNLDESKQLVLFRAAQEALTNVAKHAQASSVAIRLRSTDASIALEVVDDGVGYRPGPASPGSGLGLLGIRERFEALGGHMSIMNHAPARGSTFTVVLPTVTSRTDN